MHVFDELNLSLFDVISYFSPFFRIEHENAFNSVLVAAMILYSASSTIFHKPGKCSS